MDITHTIALTMGLAWASGINLYAALFMLGYLGATGNMDLPPDLQVLSNPLVMFASGFMYCVEFFADKTPGVDSAWDAVHTFIRIPAGALLAAGAVGDVNQAAQLAAAILGGTLAAGTHTLKAGTRVLINTSPEPFSNWTASIAEDVMVFGGLWVALHHPLLYIVLLVLFIAMMIWLLPKLWRAIKRVGGFLARLFRGRRAEDGTGPADTPPTRLPPQSHP
jgi:hypothetical protein